MAKDIARRGFSGTEIVPAMNGASQDVQLLKHCDSIYCNAAGNLDVVMENDVDANGNPSGKITSWTVTAAYPLIPCRVAWIKGTSNCGVMIACRA